MTEQTDIEKAQADYLAACGAYEVKTQVETRKMNQAQKLAHARGCAELYGKKRAAKNVLDNLLKNKKCNHRLRRLRRFIKTQIFNL